LREIGTGRHDTPSQSRQTGSGNLMYSRAD
jgi:hypothetical protein